MNRPDLVQVSLLLLIAALAGCADDRSTSTTSETENVVTARELLVDSILPAWVPRDFRPSVATLRLDSTHLPFELTDSVGRDVAFLDAQGVPMPFDIVYWDKSGRSARVHLRIDDPGSSRFSRVRMLWKQPLAGRGDEVATWNGISPDRRRLANTLLVDDFEDGDLVSGIPSGTRWFTGAPQESTSIQPPLVLTESSGNVLSATFVADAAKYRYVVLKLDLGAAPRAFRGLDSLTLDARGPTVLSVQLEHVFAGSTRKAWVHLRLDSTLKSLTIKPDDFLPADSTRPAVVGWVAARDSINTLSFLMSGGTQVWMDNVRFHGLNQDDFR